MIKYLLLASALINNSPLQQECLSKAIYGEARSETLQAQKEVAMVILNRVKSSKFPDTICEVVEQPHQFSSRDLDDPNYLKTETVYAGWELTSLEIKTKKRVDTVAGYAIIEYRGMISRGKGYETIYHFHRDDVKPDWSYKLEKGFVEGRHIFYKGF